MRLDRAKAEAIFDQAVAIAESGRPLPEEWVTRITRLGEAPSKTFIAMLGTALLARATEEAIDPLTLKESAIAAAGREGYSARGLAQRVLVPSALRHGVHLGVTGREPLNNQPFYAKDRVHRKMPVRPGDRQHLQHLVKALERIGFMDSSEALHALAAFVRIRQQVALLLRPHILAVGRPATLPALVTATARFLAADPEGGRRGQAFMAAALDMPFDEVVTSRVNDPGRRGPGDVRVFKKSQLRLPAEIKQKPVTETDVLLFAQAIAEWKLPAGLYAALDPNQVPLHAPFVNETATERYGIGIILLTGVAEVLAAVAAWGLLAIDELLERFPPRMLTRMEELEVTPRGRREWAEMFAAD